jgi:hypothetical protein
MVAGQRSPSVASTRQVVTVHFATDTLTIDLGGEDTGTAGRTTEAGRSIKPSGPARDCLCFQGNLQSMSWD